MISRFNYTDRKKLKHSSVNITLHDGNPRMFDAAFALDEHRFPPDAEVIVEATCSGSSAVRRFEFNTVGELRPPSNRRLAELHGDHIIFSVKIVDRRQDIGRLIGLAEGIRPARPDDDGTRGRMGILPVNPVDLGQRVWRISYRETEVYLDVNKHIPDIKEIAYSNRQFRAMVYPEIVRQILERVIVFEGRCEPMNDDDDWCDLWLRFGINWHPDHTPPPDVQQPVDNADREEIDTWIEDVVSALAEHYAMRDRFIEALAPSE